MKMIKKIQVSTGIYWIEIAAANFRMLCGVPADAVKHLMLRGLIIPDVVDGVSCETGPNAILLSDLPVQNGSFSNLAEFPVLQMLYRQGMFLPGHPNNTGCKPMLIGNEDQVKAQLEYIYRGNYGLVSKQEIEQTGVSPETADLMMRIKLRFAFGNIRNSGDFIQGIAIAADPVDVNDGVQIMRTGSNRFDISYQGETVGVDLNLVPGENYQSPYPLNFHNIERGYFEIIHSGDGDGWDVKRPAMSSILIFQGAVYLIDAGPNIEASLRALGIGINEVEGIFHTHSHDDHFAGITTLIRAGKRIKYYATPLVRSAVAKKVSALLSVEESLFGEFFDIHDLVQDQWNSVNGLDVRPLYSPHPVENTIFLFRTLGRTGEVSYAHFADIAAFSVLEGMVVEAGQSDGITAQELDRIKADYHIAATVKKIDAGGGMIHGEPEDFRTDPSDMIILSHRAGDFSEAEREIGSGAPFGTTHQLVKSFQIFHFRSAFLALCRYFWTIKPDDLRPLANNDLITINPEEIVIKEGEVVTSLYLIVTGTVETLNSRSGKSTTFSAGALIGDSALVNKEPASKTYRTSSFVRALKIDAEQFMSFVDVHGLLTEHAEAQNKQAFLEEFDLLNEGLPQVVLSDLARYSESTLFAAGDLLADLADDKVFLVSQGKLQLMFDGVEIEEIQAGGFFGERSVIAGTARKITLKALEDSEIYGLPADIIGNVPILRWKLLESIEHRRSLIQSKS